MPIPFTQYMRPNGEKQRIFAPMPEGYDDKVAKIFQRGLAFEAEVLTTGQVSLTVTDGEQDIAIVLSANDASIDNALKELIDHATN